MMMLMMTPDAAISADVSEPLRYRRASDNARTMK
jgi:hypothetical protein